MSSHSEDQDEDEGMEWEEVDVHRTDDHHSSPDQTSPTAETYTIILSKAADQRANKKTHANSALERQIRHQVHRLHTITLLVAGLMRNRLLNDGLLKARLLSLVPLPLVNAFNYFSPETHPLARDRSRLFDSALKDLISWWWQSFQINDSFDGMISRTWADAETLYNNSDRVEGKGKGKASQNAQEDSFLELLESGEPIHGVKSLMKRALMMKGSRDMSAQLFTSLLRALNIPARLVFSLQPVTWRGIGAGGKSANPPIQLPESNAADFKTTRSNAKPESMVAQSSKHKSRRSELATKALKATRIAKSKSVCHPNVYRGIESQVDRRVNDGDNAHGISSSFGIECAGSDNQVISRKAPVIKLRKSKPQKSRNWAKSPSPEPKLMNRPPVFWTEVYSRPLKEWYCVDVTRKRMRCKHIMEPSKNNPENKMIYVIAYEEDHFIRDVTVRYTQSFGASIMKARLPLPRKNESDWFEQVATLLKRPYKLARDIKEDIEMEKAQVSEAMPSTCAGFKNHPKYALERHLRREEVIYPKKPIGTFRGDPVYPRSSVIVCKGAETYLREGKRVKGGENPLKMIKPRIVTINRKREAELLKMDGQPLPLQGLFAEWQTELLIPPPIVNGIIPRNEYGNFDLFAPHMLPKGAKHLPYKGIAKTAKKLQVSYADAVVSFEFHKNRSIPVIEGIVVPNLEAEFVLDAYWTSEEATEQKELQKLEERCLKKWKKLIIGLRIKQRLKEEYGSSNYQKPIDGVSQLKDVDPEPDTSLSFPSALDVNTHEAASVIGDNLQMGSMDVLPLRSDIGQNGFSILNDCHEVHAVKSVTVDLPSEFLKKAAELPTSENDQEIEPLDKNISLSNRRSSRNHPIHTTIGALASKDTKRQSASPIRVNGALMSSTEGSKTITSVDRESNILDELEGEKDSLNSSPLTSPLSSPSSHQSNQNIPSERTQLETQKPEQSIKNDLDSIVKYHTGSTKNDTPSIKRPSRAAAIKAKKNILLSSPAILPGKRTLRPRK